MQMGGQMRQAGNPAWSDAITAGMTEGKSRAEMRQEIERLSAENNVLRARIRQVEESWEKERRCRMNADIECRAKSRALIELRRGNAGAWARLLEQTNAEQKSRVRFVTVLTALTSLGIVAIICMAIITLVG